MKGLRARAPSRSCTSMDWTVGGLDRWGSAEPCFDGCRIRWSGLRMVTRLIGPRGAEDRRMCRGRPRKNAGAGKKIAGALPRGRETGLESDG